jgi:DNA polymerase-3 subunit delta'
MIFPWQQTQWQQVSQLITAERLPHAMLLLGNQGLGKAEFANTMAHAVLCQQPGADHQACGRCKSCELLAVGTHPDLYQLKPTAPPTSKSKNPAANSLLKTLEEPGQNVLMLLVTSRPHRLPVTIRSRSQLLRFTEPDEKQALDWLQSNQQGEAVTAIQLQQALKHAYGSPLAALDHLQDADRHQVLAEAMTAAVSGKNTLDYAAQLAKFAKIQTLELMMSWASDLTRLITCGADTEIINESHRAKLQTMAKKVNQQRLFRFHEQLNFNLSHSSIAVNEQLLWENLLLSWDNL